MNTDIKILKKTSKLNSTALLKRVYTMAKWDLFLKFLDSSPYENLITITHINRREKNHDFN